VLAAATELYANRLPTDEPALAYMARRGFRRDILEQYRVGYASGDELVAYLRWRRLPIGAALRTGLLTQDGRETLAGRVTLVELRDGRPIWLIGRVLADPGCERKNEGPSYLGLPGAKPCLDGRRRCPIREQRSSLKDHSIGSRSDSGECQESRSWEIESARKALTH
jgi:hypothetical protein